MKEARVFVEKADFEEYLSRTPEINSTLLIEHQAYQTLDVGNIEYFNFEPLTLKFYPYQDFYLLKNPIDNKLYLGDINLGGHVGAFRIMKINRQDIFDRPDFLKGYYENYSAKMW